MSVYPFPDGRGSAGPPTPSSVMVVFHSGVTKSADEFGRGFVWLSWMKEATFERPIVGTYIDGIEGEDSGQAMFLNPLFSDFPRGENASRKTLVRCSVENPYVGHVDLLNHAWYKN